MTPDVSEAQRGPGSVESGEQQKGGNICWRQSAFALLSELAQGVVNGAGLPTLPLPFRGLKAVLSQGAATTGGYN